MTMTKLMKSVSLVTTAILSGAAAAQAADLPSRKSAPVEYVRICDAYGTGFFYIPGTDTCLKLGGLVVAEARSFDARFSASLPTGNGTTKATNLYTSIGNYTQARARDSYGYAALGRVELDARTGTAWGALRTFVRVDSYYGAGESAATGSFSNGNNTVLSTNAQPVAARYTVLLNKAFIQFAGLTAGYAQSFFDFYADAYNFESLKGSNATVALFGYTASAGNGFTATVSAEDSYSRRALIGTAALGGPGLTAGGATQATPSGGRLPDFVGNLRWDQPWGAIQLTGATHYVTASLYNTGAITVANAAVGTTSPQPLATANQLGFAGQLGVQLNLDQIAPGDKIWFQGTYSKGAVSYTEGNNLGFNNGAPNAQRYPGSITQLFGVGYTHSNDYDCTFTTAGTCDRTEAYALLAAYKHYWMPTLSSAVYGSYQKVNNSLAALGANPGGAFGAVNYGEIRTGTNLLWTPVKGFDIGTEFFYAREMLSGPAINAFGSQPQIAVPQVPKFSATQNIYEGRVRVQRAF